MATYPESAVAGISTSNREYSVVPKTGAAANVTVSIAVQPVHRVAVASSE